MQPTNPSTPKLKYVGGNLVPPDGFSVTFSEDGFVAKATDLTTLFDRVLKHYQDNDYPIPESWKEDAIDQACRLMPPGFCRYEDGNIPDTYINTRIRVEDVANATRVFISWTMGGLNTVEISLAESRAKTCASCYANIPVEGCAPCFGLINIVADVTGNKGTEADGLLKNCAICHCLNRAQVWVPIEHLAKGVTDQMMKEFKMVPFCWKWQEIEELKKKADGG